jgi:uncharacterized protein YciI
MLIAISKYLKPLPEVDLHRDEHRKFLKTLLSSNKLVVSGRQNPPVGGVIITQIKSIEEFKKILAEDPFCKAGVSEYTIIEFIPNLFDDPIRAYVDSE